MTGNIVRHPHHGLMAETEYERRVVDSAEAEKTEGRDLRCSGCLF